MSEIPTTEPTRTWMEVIALLCAAASSSPHTSDPRRHSLALGAMDVASGALALLPPELGGELDDVVLEPAFVGADVAELVREAERRTRRHPVEQLPRGASRIIVELGDLMAEVVA